MTQVCNMHRQASVHTHTHTYPPIRARTHYSDSHQQPCCSEHGTVSPVLAPEDFDGRAEAAETGAAEGAASTPPQRIFNTSYGSSCSLIRDDGAGMLG